MTERMLWILAPLILIEVTMKIVALLDLRRREVVRGSRAAWVAAILLVGVGGWLAYFLVGRGEEAPR